MAEKFSELTPRENGCVNESDEQIIWRWPTAMTMMLSLKNNGRNFNRNRRIRTIGDVHRRNRASAGGKSSKTRRKWGRTIDAIQEKLSLSNFSEQVKDQVTEQISNAYETAKDSVYEGDFRKGGKIMNIFGKELSKTSVRKNIAKQSVSAITTRFRSWICGL